MSCTDSDELLPPNENSAGGSIICCMVAHLERHTANPLKHDKEGRVRCGGRGIEVWKCGRWSCKGSRRRWAEGHGSIS